MAPFGNDDKQTFEEHSTDSSDSNELQTVTRKSSECNKNKNRKMEETMCSKDDSVVIDTCAENGTCSKSEKKNSSTTTLQSVS